MRLDGHVVVSMAGNVPWDACGALVVYAAGRTRADAVALARSLGVEGLRDGSDFHVVGLEEARAAIADPGRWVWRVWNPADEPLNGSHSFKNRRRIN